MIFWNVAFEQQIDLHSFEINHNLYIYVNDSSTGDNVDYKIVKLSSSFYRSLNHCVAFYFYSICIVYFIRKLEPQSKGTYNYEFMLIKMLDSVKHIPYLSYVYWLYLVKHVIYYTRHRPEMTQVRIALWVQR